MIISIVALVVITEIIALVWLATSVARYKNFWEAKAEESGDITYIALGDSAAQAIGASSPMKGYVGQIAERIHDKSGKKVRIINYSKTGARLEDYLHEQAPKLKNASADIVTIEIGANNIVDFEANEFRGKFRKVLDTLPAGAFVSNMPVFNSRPGSGAPAKQASQIIAEEMKAFPDLIFVDLQKQTAENQSIFGFAPDLFHPNNLGYRNWTNAFWEQIQKDPALSSK